MEKVSTVYIFEYQKTKKRFLSFDEAADYAKGMCTKEEEKALFIRAFVRSCDIYQASDGAQIEGKRAAEKYEFQIGLFDLAIKYGISDDAAVDYVKELRFFGMDTIKQGILK